MNTMLLKYVVEVEKEGSISKAAESLYMNQPYLSKCIRELEESVGIKIFRRTSKGVIPTQKGLEFLSLAMNYHYPVVAVEGLTFGPVFRSDIMSCRQLESFAYVIHLSVS